MKIIKFSYQQVFLIMFGLGERQMEQQRYSYSWRLTSFKYDCVYKISSFACQWMLGTHSFWLKQTPVIGACYLGCATWSGLSRTKITKNGYFLPGRPKNGNIKIFQNVSLYIPKFTLKVPTVQISGPKNNESSRKTLLTFLEVCVFFSK